MSPLLKRRLGTRIADYLDARRFFAYDRTRFLRHSGAFSSTGEAAQRAKIIRLYHIVEKGLTMPNRHLAFGVEVVRTLMALIDNFKKRYGCPDCQVDHAVAVVQSYRTLHAANAADAFAGAGAFWQEVCTFCNRHSQVAPSLQPHVSSDAFYALRTAEFPEFARARHVVRHYSSTPVDMADIRKAVEVACTAPTACNRQHCHVYCVTDKRQMAQILDLQGGCRGFGHLADKLLVVTSDLASTVDLRERNDVYTNGGFFAMQLCNALFFYRIAYCILNWTHPPKDDVRLRRILPIRPSEEVVVMLTCGIAPEEFDVAASPRRNVAEVLTVL